MKKMIITGSTGMIGHYLVREALSRQYEVWCIIRRGCLRASDLPVSGNLNIVEADLCEYHSLTLDGQFDCFVHLAWDKTFGMSRDDVDIQLKNIEYTLDAVRLAKRLGCSVFVGAGSQAEYGVLDIPLKGSTPVSPESGYGIAKYTAGKLAGLLCQQMNMRFNWIRITSTYGLGDAAYTLVSYVIDELLAGRSPELTHCVQQWDYLHGKDAAKAFIAVVEHGVNGKTYPLGSGDSRKLSSYVNEIAQIVNPSIILGYGKKIYYPHQPMFLVPDITELTTDTGWKPEIIFRDGINKIVDAKR